MKKILNRLPVLVLFLLSQVIYKNGFSNAAQPGVWNAGGTVFTMLFPGDSATFKKVQMQEERIYIQLYKGYAVVKGTYFFRNTTKEKLNFKMGYPVNGIYYGGTTDLNGVILDSLSRFKIRAQGNWLPLLEQPQEGYGNITVTGDNWRVWQMTFNPEERQTVEVYFIVNTNKASIRRGYRTDKKNAFIYLLESGSVWCRPIEKGSFYLQLMDGLSAKDIKGISKGFGFAFNETSGVYAGEKNNFSPTPDDNLVVTYYAYNEKFSFNAITAQADQLFLKIDQLEQMPLQTLSYTEIRTGDPYETEGSTGDGFPGLITGFVMLAPFIIGIITLVIICWATVKWVRLSRKNKKR